MLERSPGPERETSARRPRRRLQQMTLRKDTKSSAHVPSGPRAIKMFFGLIVALLLTLGIASTVHAETANSGASSSASYSLSSEYHEQDELAEASARSSSLTVVACMVGAILGVMAFARFARAGLLAPGLSHACDSAYRAPTPVVQQLLPRRLDPAQLQVSRT